MRKFLFPPLSNSEISRYQNQETSETKRVRLLFRHYGLRLGLLRGNALRGQGSPAIGQACPPIGQTPPILLAAGHVILTKTKMGREVSYFERWNV